VSWQQLAFVCDSPNKCGGTATFDHVRQIVANPTCDSIAGLRPRKGAFFFRGRGTACLASHTQIVSQLANGLPVFCPIHP
jgi:copper homeostasis protein CutC